MGTLLGQETGEGEGSRGRFEYLDPNWKQTSVEHNLISVGDAAG